MEDISSVNNIISDKVLLKRFRGISVRDLINVLNELEPETKVCIEILGDNFPIKTISECVYYSWDNGKKVQADKGILIR